VEATAVNTVILLASGALLPLAARALREHKSRAYTLALASFIGGLTFLCVQGFEWARLITEGLTMTTSVHGAFFYLVVGIHALHVIGALCAFAWVVWRIKRGTVTHAQMSAMQVLWSFVVLVWPALYVMVYLG
jgi:cytochrome c oxidase subunit 3